MNKIWPKKKFLLLIFVILAFIFSVYFVFKKKTESKALLEPSKGKIDAISPVTSIVSALNNQWISNSFLIEIRDKDYGGLNDPGTGTIEDLARCDYIIDTSIADRAYSRRCNSSIQITLKEGDCSVQGDHGSLTCAIHAYSTDQVGNQSIEAIATYGVDWTPPTVSRVYVSNPGEEQIVNIKQGILTTFKINISDPESGIAGCNLFMKKRNEKEYVNLGTMDFFSEIPCFDCIAQKNYKLLTNDLYFFRASCQDMAKNQNTGLDLQVGNIPNNPPKISFCRVNSMKGRIQDGLQFETSANDVEGDDLFYEWNFGDGNKSNEQNPIHKYIRAGTYEPMVKISDGKNDPAVCNTAWVAIGT